MKSFIKQFRKAKEQHKRLIYDGVQNRWLITDKTHWQNWPKHTLVKNFK